MGQIKSKERHFKQGFKELLRSKALKNNDKEKKQWELCLSTWAPNTPEPTFCLSVYTVSFLNLQLPPVSPS
jgi:hypothetical protein